MCKMNCGDCKDYDKTDCYCERMKNTVLNPSWEKPCVKEKDEITFR